MQKYWVLKALKIALIAVVACLVFGYVIEHLWNWLMPALFGSRLITFWQGLGLFVFSKVLFGGIHRHGGHRGRRRWRQHMEERWGRMTPEERERFRSGMRGCRGRFGSRHAPVTEPPTASPAAQM